jgi:hypothetical protein
MFASFHPCHLLCIPFIYTYLHAYIGSPERVTMLEFELMGEENPPENQQEAPGGDVQVQEQLPDWIDHAPTSYLKGKPQSILNLPTF